MLPLYFKLGDIAIRFADLNVDYNTIFVIFLYLLISDHQTITNI